MLLDTNATYEAMRSAMQSLVASSKAGDVVVVQYAGHGTSIPGGGAEPDEAIVPVDFTSGALFLDKELANIFNSTPAGVNLTCFFDCCHSGDITRLLLRGEASRPRFLQLTPEQINAFTSSRAAAGWRFMPDRRRGDRDISFAACRRDESAFETGGHGDFTMIATKLLHGGIPSVSNQEFQSRLAAGFGFTARQHPQLIGAIGLFGIRVLQPIGGSATSGASGTAPAPTPETSTAGSDRQPGDRTLRVLAQGYRQLADYIDREA